MIKICLNSSKYLSSTPLHRFGVVRSRIWRIGCARTFCKDERPLAEIIGDTKRGIPRTYPSFMYRWAEAIDEKIGHWKIWRPFYDSTALERAASKDLRLVYKDPLVSRGALARGIMAGYLAAGVLIAVRIFNFNDFGTTFAEQPYVFALAMGTSLAFVTYFSVGARAFVASIHAIEPKNQIAKSQRVPGLEMLEKKQPKYMLTTARPWIGTKQEIVFTLKDVQIIDLTATPLWLRFLHFIGPSPGNYLIQGRKFFLKPDSFRDGNFYDNLLVACSNPTPKTNLRKR